MLYIVLTFLLEVEITCKNIVSYRTCGGGESEM
jgi:hypothetical protein